MNYGESLQKVRETNPAVQCITNFVTVNDCANIILAAGGTPAMTMDVREVREGVEGMDALVCNLGAIESVDSMIIAGQHANELGIPVVLDPVAAGNTTLRRYSIRELLEQFRNMGIRILMDDFGTGYSSLSTLNMQCFDTLKLDKSLIDHIGDKNGETLLYYVISMGQRLGLHITAEGVENKIQLEFLKVNHCDDIQGFLFSKPLPAVEFEKILTDS